MSSKKGKEFYFPRNVKKDYEVYWGYTLQQIIKVIAPAGLIGAIVVILPPHGYMFIMVKIFLWFIWMAFVLAVLTISPIPSRPNITVKDYVQFKINYMRLQKKYYLKPKKAKRIGKQSV